jgi:hypothetical protein
MKTSKEKVKTFSLLVFYFYFRKERNTYGSCHEHPNTNSIRCLGAAYANFADWNRTVFYNTITSSANYKTAPRHESNL